MKAIGKHEVIARIAGPGLVLAAVFALVLSGSCVVRAQASATSAAPPAAPPAKAASSAQAGQAVSPGKRQPGGTHEGIKVHGHWMIEVRSLDGKLVSHTEFENSLYTGGYPYTTPGAYLSRTLTQGEWGITLSGSPAPCSATIPFTFATGYAYQPTRFAFGGPFCVLSEITPPAAIEPQNCAAAPSSGCSQNLKVSTDSSGNLTLMGSVVAADSGTISQVQTILSTCAPGVSPAACASETSPDDVHDDYLNAFTAATMPTSNTPSTPCGGAGQISCAVNVPAAGDTINVSVTISFQ
jgi:hypothetical protein